MVRAAYRATRRRWGAGWRGGPHRERPHVDTVGSTTSEPKALAITSTDPAGGVSVELGWWAGAAVAGSHCASLPG